MNPIGRNIFAALFALAFAVEAWADSTARPGNGWTKPLWEVGVGGGAVYGPDFPAADESSLRGLALPYVIYRGDIFRLGDGSLASGVFVENERLKFDVSVAGSFDAESEGNAARQGMPDLDFLFEVGPQLTLRLGKHLGGRFSLALPLRIVHETDLESLAYRGLKFAPALQYRTAAQILGIRAGLSLSVGSTFAEERLQDVFYQVDPRFALPKRPAFDADGGYLGSDLSAGLRVPVSDRFTLFFRGGVSHHGGAANTASPLFRDRLNVSIGSGFVWSVYRSEATVARGG